MIRSLRAANLALLRPAQVNVLVSKRAFTAPTNVLRADIIQDIYIKEIRGYKPATLRSSDSDGHVQKFSVPKPPRSPEESDIANELKGYEAQQVEVEGQVASGEANQVEEDWFEEDEEELEARAARENQ
ncbi:hypothetical protein MMC29_003239 [Sticta canariensis]|nr:hypothetical protein [Sticta canariensis]